MGRTLWKDKLMPERHQVIQAYLDLFQEPSYLEIGVNMGTTFHAVGASKKVAVDPKFVFAPKERKIDADYYEITSDEYFRSLQRDAPLFDVIFLDGLHTFEQTLRDLMNAIDYLRRDGVIVIDDVLPSSYHASLRSIPEFEAVCNYVARGREASWMGDVFRLVYFIQSFLPSFDYASVEDNHGQLVMWRGKRALSQLRDRDVRDLVNLEFKDVILDRAAYNFCPHDDIVQRVRTAILDRAK